MTPTPPQAKIEKVREKEEKIAEIVSWAINQSKKNPGKGFIYQAVDKIITLSTTKQEEK